MSPTASLGRNTRGLVLRVADRPGLTLFAVLAITQLVHLAEHGTR